MYIAWQIPQYLCISIAEILVSVTAMEYTYVNATAELKSLSMSLFFFTQAVGNLLVAILSTVQFGSAPVQYFILAGLMLLFLAFFSFVNSGVAPSADAAAAQTEPDPSR